MNYEKDFENFLKHTNEKEVLLEEITKEIEKRGVSSLLDIGAGEGTMSTHLSEKVQRYLAVEESYYFASKLKSKGVDVMQGSFPFPIKESFDMVLVCDALPDENWRSFLSFAAEMGPLLFVTYKDRESEWVSLLKEIGEEKVEIDRVDYRDVSSFLGVKDVRSVESYVRGSPEEVTEALSFVFSDGDKKKKDRFLSYKKTIYNILKLRYSDGKSLCFPFKHFFVHSH